MEVKLKDSAQQVQDFLIARGVTFEVRELPGSTRTAQEAADSIGCQVALYDTIWAAAGTPFAVFQLRPTDLVPLTNGIWVDLSAARQKPGGI